jgi:hypothetical protein
MFQLISVAGILFWLLPLIFDGDSLQTTLNSIVFGIATTVLITWGPSVYYALRGNVTAENQHIIATVAVWIIVWTQRLYSIVYMTLDRPYWLASSAFPAFIAYMFGLTGVFIVVAPAMLKDADRSDYLWQTAVGIGCGVMAAVVSFVIQVAN